MKKNLLAILFTLISSNIFAFTYSVTFRVDMSQQNGQFTTPEVNGSFNDWCGNCNPLTDVNGDNIWELSIDLAPAFYNYKFSADNLNIQENLIAGSSCAPIDLLPYRILMLDSDTILPIVCWNSCTSCNGEETAGCSSIFFDNFESYTINQGLAGQSAVWDNWNSGTSGNERIVNSYSYSGSKSLKIDGQGTDLVLPIGPYYSGFYSIAFKMLLTTSGGYFNLLHEWSPTGTSYEWACDVFFSSNGGVTWVTGGVIGEASAVPLYEWFDVIIEIDLNADQGSLYVDNILLNTWQWSLDNANGTTGQNSIAGMNFYGTNDASGNSTYYIDDMQVNKEGVLGCTDLLACNYSVVAHCNNGTCIYPSSPCNDFNAYTINDQIDSDCVCEGQLLGCTDNDACNYNPQADLDNGSCLFLNTTCNDNNPYTMLDQTSLDCNCQGTPYNYGSMGNQGTINLCPGAVANTFSVSAPLNLASFAAQWYYREGSSGCPSGNSTAGWEMIAGANSLSFSTTEFTGTRTFACFITPSAIYNIPARWATGCRTVSYYSFSAQAIIGNPNITPFSTVTYAVNPISGNTYNWNITNGAITSGQGTNVITVLWGQNGPYQVTLTEGNNTCNDTSTLLVVNGNCSLSVNAVSTDGASLCQGETSTLEAITQTTGVNYQWYLNGNVIAGAINSSLEIYTGGNYQVLISQGACTAVSQTLVINTLSPTAAPQLVVDYLSAGCSGGSAIVSTVGGSFSTYAWNNGETSASIEVNQSGDYSVQLTDANGCQASAGPVSVNLSLQEALPICIVTVDPLTNKNIVVWEPQFSEVSASYTVYKEANVADEYVAIGSVSYGQDGIFEDVNSNAAVQASRYKLGVMDTCGVESSLSALHKTIHLTSNVGLNGTVNLIWSHYEGFYFGSYNIYRGDSPGNLTLLSTIASNLNSYTDLTPPDGVYYYVIEVEGISCDPSRDVIVSRSNVVYIAPNSIAQVNPSILSVYPIPASDELHLALSSDALGNDVVITSTTGAIVVQQKITSEKMSLSLDACAAGLYILQVRDGNTVVATRRVVVE